MKMLSFSFLKSVLVLILCLLTLSFVILFSTYISSGKIVAIEYDYGDILVEDPAGEVWVFGGSASRACGDIVVMFMWNHFTPSIIEDDIILFLR